ncbi:MAG: site-2 protease family protein [Anaerolineales bacterium]|nr:site-2 protease family protein [Anaerolineales bacterium]
MKANITLGQIWGIPIGINASWFLVFGLITLSLSTGYFPAAYPQLSSISTLALGVLTSLLFFSSVLAHELGHSFIALREKLPVKGITLFIFGGVAQIGQEPRSPGAEFRIAIAGPLTSVALAALFGGLWFASQDIVLLAAPSLYLARLNLMLAVFNMIPGFPLDGGRVLRALVWWWTKNYARATQVASAAGQIVAFGFIGIGLVNMLSGRFADGLWLAFIGWFLRNAAASAALQLNVQEKLRGATVAQAMSRDCAPVNGLATLHQLVHERVLTNGQSCFFVTDYFGRARGVLSLQDITRVPQSKWRFTTAEQVMKPVGRHLQFDLDMDLLAALQSMDEANIAEAPVVDRDQPVGLLSRDQILRYLRLRSELGV